MSASGALCAASLIVIGPLRALVVTVMAALLAHAIRRGVGSPKRLVAIVASRAVALLAGTIVYLALPSTTPTILVYVVVPASS